MCHFSSSLPLIFLNTHSNDAHPLCVPLCLHPLPLFTALSARHQVISSFAIAMATKRCAWLTAIHYVSEQGEKRRKRNRCSGEQDQSSSVTTATARMKTNSKSLSTPNHSGPPPPCVYVCVCSNKASLKLGVCDDVVVSVTGMLLKCCRDAFVSKLCRSFDHY